MGKLPKFIVGDWIDACVRSKIYGTVGDPDKLGIGIYRHETTFDGGKNQHTLYVVVTLGFAFAIHFPSKFMDKLRPIP